MIASEANVFALKRGGVYCYTNVSDRVVMIETAGAENLLTGERVNGSF
ncbi:hypothetical protein [Listeria rocourtiae]